MHMQSSTRGRGIGMMMMGTSGYRQAAHKNTRSNDYMKIIRLTIRDVRTQLEAKSDLTLASLLEFRKFQTLYISLL